MSCGRPHAVPCTRVLSVVHEYLDGEIAEVERVDIVEHLSECPPCEEQVAVLRAVKVVVHRSCVEQTAPESLRVSIMAQVRQVSVSRGTGPVKE
jgi:mycothiol system anti-sigma-R factor